MKVIDFENHFFTTGYLEYLRQRNKIPRLSIENTGPVMLYSETMIGPRSFELHDKHLEVGEKRIKDMDEAGIDIEVLSLAPPGIQRFTPEEGTQWAKTINNELAEITKRYPDRFTGLAVIAPQNPEEASLEMERCIGELGFKGVILHSHANNEYLDKPKFRPIFRTAARLGVPLFLHPELPSELILPGFEDYGFKLASTSLGFAFDVALHSMRLICSGLFDEYPGLQIVLAHLGEGLPFWLQRIDSYSKSAGQPVKVLAKRPSDYLKSNFTVLTSAMHNLPSFTCAYMALGADKIAFGTDFPYEVLKPSVDFIKQAPIPDSEKEKILHFNIEKLLKI